MPLPVKEIKSKALALLIQPGYTIPPDVSVSDKARIEQEVRVLRRLATLASAANTRLPRSRSRSRGGKSKKRKTRKWY
jgi:hypothetical protein